MFLALAGSNHRERPQRHQLSRRTRLHNSRYHTWQIVGSNRQASHKRYVLGFERPLRCDDCLNAASFGLSDWRGLVAMNSVV